MPDLMVVKIDRELVKLTIDGVEYEYVASYYHTDRFRRLFRQNRMKALNYIKANSETCRKTGRVINWEAILKGAV